jgi:hypothetical protein
MRSQSVPSANRSAKTAKRGSKKSAKASRAATSKTANGPRSKVVAAARSMRSSMVGKTIGAGEREFLRTYIPSVQPPSSLELPRQLHKYLIGETVYYTSPSFGRAAASGSYTVVKLLPSEGDDYQYRIKSSGEAFERVAKESQLERI